MKNSAVCVPKSQLACDTVCADECSVTPICEEGVKSALSCSHWKMCIAGDWIESHCQEGQVWLPEIGMLKFWLSLPRLRVVSVKTIGPKIVFFLRNCIAESTAYFSVIIFNYIFTPMTKIKIFEKYILAWKKICCRRPIVNFSHIMS